jgi:hypothetical protein
MESVNPIEKFGIVKDANYVCPSCNHTLSGGCSLSSCDSCGVRIKMYDGLNYDVDEMNNEYSYDDDKLSNKSKHVVFNENLNQYQYSSNNIGNALSENSMYDDEIILSKVSEISKNEDNASDIVQNQRFEHMSSGEVGGGLSLWLCCQLCLFIIVFIIASRRGELYHNKTKSLNFSLLVCMFLFPQIYIGYVLVDWLTKPAHYNC